jgi:choline dehydrogenase-like flavoprotein
MPLTTEYTTFTRDVFGRYICNTFDEALVTIDPNARAAAGLPARGDLRPFDFVIIGGGTFGAALAEHLWFRSTNRSERMLVLEGGPFVLPEHVQNAPVLGLGAGDPRKDHLPQKEVWGLAWNSSDPIGFPGLAYCVGGRSVFWGGWSPRLLDSELPTNVWPKAVLDDLTPKNLTDGRKGYFRQSSDQIGVTETNDFIFGDLHRAMRKQLFDGISTITDAMDLGSAGSASGGVRKHAHDSGRLGKVARYRSAAQPATTAPDTPQSGETRSATCGAGTIRSCRFLSL